MKKLFAVMIGMILVLGLVGCKPNKPKTNEEPVIEGVKVSDTIILGDSWNALTGVKATDKEDGVITSKIILSADPVMSHVNGVFTPEELGEYNIKYSVTDSDGNEVVELTVLNVMRKVGEKELYKKFDFSHDGDVDLDGWKTTVAEEATATGRVDKGRYHINIEKVGTSDSHVKFEKNSIEAKAGVAYRIDIHLSASQNGLVTFVVNNAAKGWDPLAGDWDKEFAKESGVISLAYTSEVDLDSIEYLLQFGKQPIGVESIDIYIEKIEVFETVGGGDNLTIFQAKLEDETEIEERKDEGATTEITVSNQEVVYTIESYTAAGDPWNLNFAFNTNVNLTQGKKYIFRVDVTAQHDQFYELCFEDSNFDWQIRAGFQSGTLSGTKTLEVAFVASMDIEGLFAKFALGKSDGKTSNVLTFKNILLEEEVGITTSTTKEFVAEESIFGTNNSDGGVGSAYTEDGKLIYSVTKFGGTDWHNKIFIKSVELEADALYTISFTVKANKTLDCFFAFNIVGKWDAKIISTISISETEKTFTYTMDAEIVIDMNFEILFQFGGFEKNQGPALIEFSSIEIYRQA